MKVIVGNRFGDIIDELDMKVGPTSWVLNEIGRTDLSIASSDPKATELNLRIGNRVYIDFDNGLPAWGGVIDQPRSWSRGVVKAHCYDIGYLLQFRLTDKNVALLEYSAGDVFEFVLNRANQKDPLGIDIGYVWKGGLPHYPVYNFKTIWYVLNYSLRQMETCDFRFIPRVEGNRISFEANFYQMAGGTKSNSVALVEDKNIESRAIVEEQGEIYNRFYAVSEGSQWDETRLVISAQVNESVALYGLREGREIFNKISMTSALELAARRILDDSAYPRRLFTVAADDNEPGRFTSYDIGDTVWCSMPNYTFGGLEAEVRIIGREYFPDTGKLDLLLEQPKDVEYFILGDELEYEQS